MNVRVCAFWSYYTEQSNLLVLKCIRQFLYWIGFHVFQLLAAVYHHRLLRQKAAQNINTLHNTRLWVQIYELWVHEWTTKMFTWEKTYQFPAWWLPLATVLTMMYIVTKVNIPNQLWLAAGASYSVADWSSICCVFTDKCILSNSCNDFQNIRVKNSCNSENDWTSLKSWTKEPINRANTTSC